MAHYLFLTSSGRANGNTEMLARRAAAHLPAAAQSWRDLSGLPPFHDRRPLQPPSEGRLADLAADIAAATDLVFVAPIYWYCLPAPAKLLLDHLSGWLDVPGMNFAQTLRGKRLWLVTVRANADFSDTLHAEAVLSKSGEWLGMQWGGALHGVGTDPGDILSDKDALARAETFFTL